MFIELLQHLLSNIQILLLKESPSDETRTADPTTTVTTTTAVTTSTTLTTTTTNSTNNTTTNSIIHSTEPTTTTIQSAAAVDDQQVTIPIQHRINLAQSAMMCIDIITKHYKQLSIKLKYHYKYIQDKYELTFFEILKDLTNITILLSDRITTTSTTITSKVSSKSTLATTNNTTGSSIQLHDDILALSTQQQQGQGQTSNNQGSGEVEVVAKILGSSFLVVGSLCSVLSGRCLPLLAVCIYSYNVIYSSVYISLILYTY